MAPILRVLSCMIRQPALPPLAADLHGKTVVLTGPTIGGIGFETAKALHAAGAHLILGARNPTKGAQALSAIRAAYTGTDAARCPTARVLPCDVGEPSSVMEFATAARAAVAEVSSTPDGHVPDLLVCNAGAQFPQQSTNSAGVELSFAVCALGHHLLVEKVPAKRVVWVSGDVYVLSNAMPALRREVTGYQAYQQACLGRLLLTREWRKRGVDAVAVHPGVVASEFVDVGPIGKWIIRKCMISPELGARAVLTAAVAPAETLAAQAALPYFHNKFGWMQHKADDLAMNAIAAKQLFDECDKECGITRE